MGYDYRQHFPFQMKIRNKIFLPFIVVALGITMLGVKAVTDIFHQRLTSLLMADMQRSARTVEAAMAAKLREMEHLGQLIAAGNFGAVRRGEPRPEMPRGVREALGRSGIQISLLEGGRGLPVGAFPLRRDGRGGSVGFERPPGTGELALFAHARFQKHPTRGVYLREPLEEKFLASIREQTGVEVLLLAGTPGLPSLATAGIPPGVRRAVELAAGEGEVLGSAVVGEVPWDYHLSPLMAGQLKVATIALVRSNMDIIGWERDLRGDIMLASLWFTALFILVYAVVVRRITQPLHSLMEAVERVGRGDLGASSRVRSRDEVGRLAAAFDTMTASLRRQQGELQEATQTIIHQERLASLGQLVAGIIHEIKNPLNNLSLMVRLASQEERQGERSRYLESTRTEINRISAAVEGLLNQARKPVYTSGPVAVNERIQGFLNQMTPLLTSQGIETELRLDEELPTIELAEAHLDQVLYNLLLNAREAMERGGRVTLTTGTVRESSDESPPRRYLRLTLADTGAGIRPENLDRVCDPFFTTKPPGKGTGLGLAIVKGIVEGYEGRLNVASCQGEGTIIEILLPLPPL